MVSTVTMLLYFSPLCFFNVMILLPGFWIASFAKKKAIILFSFLFVLVVCCSNILFDLDEMTERSLKRGQASGYYLVLMVVPCLI